MTTIARRKRPIRSFPHSHPEPPRLATSHPHAPTKPSPAWLGSGHRPAFVPVKPKPHRHLRPEDVLDYVYGIPQPARSPPRRWPRCCASTSPRRCRCPLPAGAFTGLWSAVVLSCTCQPAALPVPLAHCTGGGTPAPWRTPTRRHRPRISTPRSTSSPVAPEAWAPPIEGYQPAQKWLEGTARPGAEPKSGTTSAWPGRPARHRAPDARVGRSVLNNRYSSRP
jgi:hypothetical protein